MARVPYISKDDLPPEKRYLYDHIEETRSSAGERPGVPNSFRALLNSPEAAEFVASLGEYIRLKSPLDPAIRETAILSTARALNSQYEWSHHEPVARKVGVRDEVIESIKSGRAPMGLPAKEGVFAQAAKEMVKDGIVTERTFQAVEHLLGAGQTVDLLVAIGYYIMLYNVLGSLGVELEDDLTPLLSQ